MTTEPLYLFSSPSRGSYISTCWRAVTELNTLTFSSPSRGSYISTLCYKLKQIRKQGSRPLPGVLISLRTTYFTWRKNGKVLVPFPGFLYLYIYCYQWLVSVPRTFSSPSRGSYISTFITDYECDLYEFSSPSRGSYISTVNFMSPKLKRKSSRPLPGVLISLHRNRVFCSWRVCCSRPLPGVLISLLI